MRGVALRIEGSEGTIVVISTKIVESVTTSASVIVATKLPRPTPNFESRASQNDAGSVIRSWLKKKGRSSVGADKSKGYFATASLSSCGVVAAMICDKIGDLICDCGLTKIVNWSLLAVAVRVASSAAVNGALATIKVARLSTAAKKMWSRGLEICSSIRVAIARLSMRPVSSTLLGEYHRETVNVPDGVR